MSNAFVTVESKKNIAKCSVESADLENDISMVKISNQDTESSLLQHTVNQHNIHFYFCADGLMKFQFGPQYQLELPPANVMLLYNPKKDLPHQIVVGPKSKMIVLIVSVEKLHHLFLDNEGELFFLNQENINKKYYSMQLMNTQLLLSINQLFNTKLSALSNLLFLKAKGYELLSFYFNREESEDGLRNCPFLEDKNNVEKIRIAKKIMIDRMSNPPGIKELAREIGLNEYQLKVGFKNIYGLTLYGFLNDYKMDQSRKMLDSGEYKVNEVAYSIGYTNPSHYITAFKKKYGITPKKYLMSLNMF